MAWLDPYDLDPVDVMRETTPKARKRHKCVECSRPILTGSHYVRASIVYDGTAETIKTCMRCAAVRRALQDEDGSGWVIEYGKLRAALRERNRERRGDD